MTVFPLHVTMTSDWHVGAGTGRRGITSAEIVRDADGLPCLSGDAFSRLWRDGCEVAAHGLDEGDSGVFHEWVEFLFGSQPALPDQEPPSLGVTSPGEAAWTTTPLRLAPAVAAALAPRPALVRATTLLRTRVRIARATRAAARGGNRVVEMARAGLTLVGTTGGDAIDRLDDDQRRAAVNLLAIGLALIDGVGAGRRRGAGSFRARVDGLTADLDWLEAATTVPPPPARLRPVPDVTAVHTPLTGDWTVVRLALRLRQPVVVAERVVGNALRSRTAIPGSLLLPAVLARLESPAAHAAARAGDLVVTDATIAIGGVAGRPVPAGIVRDKIDHGRWCNQAVEPAPDDMQPEPVEGYIGAFSGSSRPLHGEPRMSEYTRNTIVDDVQRPTAAVGGVYTYQAIGVGTEMVAELHAAPGVLPADWVARLSTTLRLGRARRSDYGEVEVTAGQAAPPASAAGRAGGRTLRVWLLSDLLVTDERLAPSTRPADVARVLGEALGVGLTPVSWHAEALTRRIESWHRAWQLPRATLLGIAAGTCLTFEADSDVDPAQLDRVHMCGIGMRRGEGFGQVSINDPLLDARLLGLPAPRPSSPPGPARPAAPVTLASDELWQVRLVERAAWIAAIDDQADRVAATEGGRRRVLGRGYADLPATQLAGLRFATASPQVAAGWLRTLSGTPERDERWRPVRDHLNALLTGDDEIWSVLGIDASGLCASEGATQELRDELAPYARRRLVYRCLAVHQRVTQRPARRASNEAVDQ